MLKEEIGSSVSLRTSSRAKSRVSPLPPSKPATAFGSKSNVTGTPRSRPLSSRSHDSRPTSSGSIVPSSLNRSPSKQSLESADVGPREKMVNDAFHQSVDENQRVPPMQCGENTSRPQSGLTPVDADRPLSSSGIGQALPSNSGATSRPLSSSWNGSSSPRPGSGMQFQSSN